MTLLPIPSSVTVTEVICTWQFCDRAKMTVVYLDRKIVLGGVLVLALAFVFGVVIGYFGNGGSSSEAGMSGPMFERLVADKFVDEQQLVQQG